MFLAFILGGLFPLGFAPFNLWFLSIISLGCFPLILNKGKGFLRGWAYGAGVYCVGVSWIYVSLAHHTPAGPLGAGAATALLSVVLGLFYALLGYCHQLIPSQYRSAIMSISLWIAFEWLRSWIFTGFPWLFLGYTATSNFLFKQWIPIVGIYGTSFIIGIWSILLIQLIRQLYKNQNKKHIFKKYPYQLSILLLIPFINFGLGYIHWTQQTSNDPLTLALIQGNIPQMEKWDPAQAPKITYQYIDMTEKAAAQNADIIFWPEAAIPYLYSDADTAIDVIRNTLQSYPQKPTLMTGILTDGQSEAKPHALSLTERKNAYPAVRNSVFMMDENKNNDQFYHKQKLVPFGEYLPFADLITSMVSFLDAFKYGITAGTPHQPHFKTHGWTFQSLICYEIAFPQLAFDTTMHQGKPVDAIVTLSNDGWFGLSHGPSQHFQMAQFRAIELGRPVIRATNTGITGVIQSDGSVKARLEREKTDTLFTAIHKVTGQTPYSHIGPSNVLFGILILAVLNFIFRKKLQPSVD